jgi:hypothetical protein
LFTGIRPSRSLTPVASRYIFFEKRRIVEGKKKTSGRIRNEDEFPEGFPRIDGKSKQWVLTPPKWDGVVRRF